MPTEEILDMLGAVFFAFLASRFGRPPLAIWYLPYRTDLVDSTIQSVRYQALLCKAGTVLGDCFMEDDTMGLGVSPSLRGGAVGLYRASLMDMIWSRIYIEKVSGICK